MIELKLYLLYLNSQALSRYGVTSRHLGLPRPWNWYGAGALSAGPSLYQQIRSSGDFTLRPTKLLTDSEYAEWNKLLNKQQTLACNIKLFLARFLLCMALLELQSVRSRSDRVKCSTATNTFAVIKPFTLRWRQFQSDFVTA